LATAAPNTSSTPAIGSSVPGRTTTSTPTNPQITAAQVCHPGRSRRKTAASTVTRIGVMKKTEVACASGIIATPAKNSSVTVSISPPRRPCRSGLRVRSTPRPRLGR
jgi:hypothetical protein